MDRGQGLVVIGLAGLATGVLDGGVSPGMALAAALASASLALALDRSVWRYGMAAAAFGAAAMAHGGWARDRLLVPPLSAWIVRAEVENQAPRTIFVEGILDGDAELVESGARFLLRARLVDEGDGPRATSGRVQVFVGGGLVPTAVQAWTAGRTIRAPMTLRRPAEPRNPGGPSLRWQALRRRADAVGSVKSAMLVDVAPAVWWHEAAAGVRGAVRRSATTLFPGASNQTAAIVVAILIGDRSSLDVELERRLQVAGTYHVIAISGGNVALLAAWSFVISRLVLRSVRAASVLTIAIIVTYGWIAGGDPSVSRAVTGAVIYLGCRTLGLVPGPLHVLGLVAVIVGVADPLTVVDPGAWLSFGATFGIIVFAGRLIAWRSTRPRSARRRTDAVAVGVAGLVGATMAAEVALLPVQASLFSRVGIAGLALNVIAVPMIAVVQITGLAGIVLVHVWMPTAVVAAAVADLAATLIVESARLVEIAPWLSWRVPPPAIGVVVAYYALGAAWYWSNPRSWSRRLAILGWVSACLVLVTAPLTAFRQPAPGWLRLTVMDVGQGEAMLLQLPGGRTLSIDAGAVAPRFNTGDRVVTPALWASGVRRLEWLLFTHADLDHIGGAAALAATFEPREIWEGIPVPRDPLRAALAERAARSGAVWRTLERGHRFEAGGALVEVLHPPAPDWERVRPRNDDSVVLRVRFGLAELLLTGDIGTAAEARLLDGLEPAPLRILKVAHHGSRTSTSEVFLDRYRPQVAIVSAGRGNPFGHPAPDVVARLAARRVVLFRTDRDGAVILETDGRVVLMRSVGGRRWRLAVERPF